MSARHTGRRRVLQLGGTAGLVLLAGCLGDGTVEEIDELAEQSMEQLDAVGPSVEAAFQHSDGEDWNGCLDELDGVPDQLDSAREDAQNALALAESEGLTEYANTLTLLVALVDIMDDIVAELTLLCEAGTEEDYDEIDQRSQNIQELSQDFDQTEREFHQSLEDLGE